MDSDFENMRENDPYRGMRSAEDDTRPEFLRNPKGAASGESVGESSDNWGGFYKKSERNQEAADEFSAAEKGASKTADKTEDSVKGAKENEEKAEGFYSGSGKDGEKKSKRGGIGIMGKLKKRAPILAIFLGICGFSGGLFGAQTLLPFAIEELLIEKFHSIGISTSIVSDEMLDLQLKQGIREGAPDPSKIDTLFGLSDYQVQQFRINGIDAFNIEVGGKKGAALVYQKHNHTLYVPVVCKDMLDSASKDDIKKEITESMWLDAGEVGDPVGVSAALDDMDFYLAYNKASKVWRNGTSSWFDDLMEKVTEVKLSVRRTRWAGFIAGSISSSRADMKAKFNKIAKGDGSVGDQGMTVKEDVEGEEVVDEEGVGNLNATESTGAQQVYNALNSKAVKAAQAASKIACGAMKAAIAVYSTVQAYQALQFLNVISGFLESVDRVKAGDGDTSPVMEYTNNLTTAGETKDNNGKTLETRSAVGSAGFSWLFSSKNKIDPSDQSVQNVNIESLMKKITGMGDEISTFVDAMEACGYGSIISEAVDFLSDAILLVASFGIGNVLKFIAKKVVSAAVGALFQAVISVLIQGAIRQIVKVMTKNVATEWFGEDLGNAIISGASKYLGGNGTSGGQGPGTKKSVQAYLMAQHEVIAKEAEYQRATRSPFDIRSKYTFLGSLAYSILPLAYSGGGLMSFLTSAADTTSNAVVAMLPTVSAIDTDSMMSSIGDCALLEGAGIVGDAFCNPYIITDVNTTNLAATEVYDVVKRGFGGEIASTGHSGVSTGNIDDNGNIIENSNLKKYIIYCGQRTSQYNVYDAAIASQVSGETSLTNIIGNVPLVCNITNIVTGVNEVSNIEWINGRSCIVGGDQWSENKYYQRYTETERLIEGMNPNYKSPVTAMIDEYYEKNPLDTTFEGTLARFSGQTKEDVEFALALIDYYDYLDNYDPSLRYAFVKTEEPEPIFFETTTEVSELSPALVLEPFKIVYADLRGRYYTV